MPMYFLLTKQKFQKISRCWALLYMEYQRERLNKSAYFISYIYFGIDCSPSTNATATRNVHQYYEQCTSMLRAKYFHTTSNVHPNYELGTSNTTSNVHPNNEVGVQKNSILMVWGLISSKTNPNFKKLKRQNC